MLALLTAHDEKMLNSHWIVVNGTAQRPAPMQLTAMLDLNTLETLMDMLLGPGLVLQATRSETMGLASRRVTLVLRATRDPDHKGYHSIEHLIQAIVSRYLFRYNRNDTRLSFPQWFARGLDTGFSEHPARNIVDALFGGGSAEVSRTDIDQRAFMTVEAARSSLFINDSADRFAGELEIEVSLVRTWVPGGRLTRWRTYRPR